MNTEVFIKRISAWAPGITGSDEWKEWALGNKEITAGTKGPDLSFADPMFRRRLSLISKMTIQAAHDLMPLDNTKIFFYSFRGEISRQFNVNKMLIEENMLSPASFSLSVFNAPVALATMALGLKGGYSAIYPGYNSFSTSLLTAQAAILGGTAEEIAFIYADEEVPSEYCSFFNGNVPVAISFGLLLSKTPDEKCVGLKLPDEQDNPLSFLKKTLLGGMNVSP